MTKRKFYIIKTILFIISAISIYYFVLFIIEKGIKIFIEPMPYLIIAVSSFLILLLLCFLFSERPKLPEEIRKERREEEERIKKEWENLKETLPLIEITLTTNEKIKGKFLEKRGYFEDVETKNRYYETSISKIENNIQEKN